MSWLGWIGVGLGAAVAVWLILVGVLVAVGRGSDARDLARFAPDCAVLCGRLLRDPRVPRARKVALALTAVYLASPIDLVPDFLPVVGQADDVLLVVLVLRGIVRGAGPGVVAEHWPGSPVALGRLLRLAGMSAPGSERRSR